MLDSSTITSQKIELSSDFKRAFDLLEDTTDNLFITGKAGTGKSTFLDYYRRNTKKKVAVLAPTGIAALNVRGQTIHSFFKFKPRFIDKNAITPGATKKIYKQLEMLIIDEISMVRADIFDAIEKFLSLNGPRPGEAFGGVQLCVIGDLYQLPPIVSYNERALFHERYYTPFFFGSGAFELAQFGVVEFTKLYRQSDQDFISALNQIRNGLATQETIEFLNNRTSINTTPLDVTPVVLATTNTIALSINQQRLAALTTAHFTYTGKKTGEFNISEGNLPAPEELVLKVGAQVMFTRNHQARKWVNGTVGVIAALSKEYIIVQVKKRNKMVEYEVPRESWETVKYSVNAETGLIEEKIVGEYLQYPLILAWAITIHKSQGKTLDYVKIDLGKGAFASGQLYVALSRCRSLEHLQLAHPIALHDVQCDTSVIAFERSFIHNQ